MGGIGSGSWARGQWPKPTVEQCYEIDVNRWVRAGIIAPGATRAGAWNWTRDGVVVSSIDYVATAGEDGAGSLELGYSMAGDEGWETLRYAVGLQTTRTKHGGMRWWFTCPLVVGGGPCLRRVGKLYLHGRYFGCRRCHGLTYRSCQEAHRAGRGSRRLAKLASRPGGFDPDRASRVELLAYARVSRHTEGRRR